MTEHKENHYNLLKSTLLLNLDSSVVSSISFKHKGGIMDDKRNKFESQGYCHLDDDSTEDWQGTGTSKDAAKKDANDSCCATDHGVRYEETWCGPVN